MVDPEGSGGNRGKNMSGGLEFTVIAWRRVAIDHSRRLLYFRMVAGPFWKAREYVKNWPPNISPALGLSPGLLMEARDGGLVVRVFVDIKGKPPAEGVCYEAEPEQWILDSEGKGWVWETGGVTIYYRPWGRGFFRTVKEPGLKEVYALLRRFTLHRYKRKPVR